MTKNSYLNINEQIRNYVSFFAFCSSPTLNTPPDLCAKLNMANCGEGR